MAKTEKTENKDLKVEKSNKKLNKSSYSKKKKTKKNILNSYLHLNLLHVTLKNYWDYLYTYQKIIFFTNIWDLIFLWALDY